jgi:hypothetical protein
LTIAAPHLQDPENSPANGWNESAKAFVHVISAIIYSRERQQLDNISEFCY